MTNLFEWFSVNVIIDKKDLYNLIEKAGSPNPIFECEAL